MSTCPVEMPLKNLNIFSLRENYRQSSDTATANTRSRHSQTCDLYHSRLQAAHRRVDNPIYGIIKPLQVIPCLRAWRSAYLNHQISQHSSHGIQSALARQTNQGYPQPAFVLALTQVRATQKDMMPWYEETVLTADYW